MFDDWRDVNMTNMQKQNKNKTKKSRRGGKVCHSTGKQHTLKCIKIEDKCILILNQKYQFVFICLTSQVPYYIHISLHVIWNVMICKMYNMWGEALEKFGLWPNVNDLKPYINIRNMYFIENYDDLFWLKCHHCDILSNSTFLYTIVCNN